MFTWGAGYVGQLGRKFERGQKKYSAIPMIVPLEGIVVRQVSCGSCHTAVVTETGQVWTWGEGRRGELGHHQEPGVKQTPQLVENLETVFVVQVSCGGSHTVAVADTGMMYSWGWAKNGQTGHGDRQMLKVPRKIEHANGSNIKMVACGNKHTAAINKKGQALTWGCGKHGQTGLGKDDDVPVPTFIEEMKDKVMTHVACGAIHTCFVSDEGNVWIMGFGEHLGPSDTQHFFYSPKMLTLPEPIKFVSCGQAHNVALSHTGNVWCWGSGEYGQNGYGIKGNISTPRMVLDTGDVAQVAAGRYHSFALTTTGVLYSWGCGESGQLGLDSDENVALPTVLTSIVGTVVGQVACGEHHTAVLTSAPWTKPNPDVQEWLYSSKVELEMKNKFLKKNNRGLTRKDLIKLREDMKRWHVQNEQRKKDQAIQEEEERARDVSEIDSKESLKKSVTQLLSMTAGDPSRAGLLALPSVETKQEAEEPQEETLAAPAYTGYASAQPFGAASKSSGPLKLPSVVKGKRGTGADSPARMAQPDRTQALLPHMGARRQSTSARSGSRELGQTAGADQDASRFPRTHFLRDTQALVVKMTSDVAVKGESANQKELQLLTRRVMYQRKDYDTLCHDARARHMQLLDLQRELELLGSATKLQHSDLDKYNKRLDELKMQFNTVTIKIAETAENRRNYELNIAHLKEEDFEHFNQLKTLRKHIQDNNNFFKKLNELKSLAVEEAEKTREEEVEFRREIQDHTQFLHQQLQQFSSILSIVREQNDKREQARCERSEAQRARVRARVEKLLTEAEATDKEAGGLTSRLNSLDLKLRHFEDAYQKIAAATGLTDPDAIVNKWFFKNEIKEQLEVEIAEKATELEERKKDLAELKETFEGLRSNHKEQTWRDVTVLNESHREVEHKATKAQAEAERAIQRLVLVQEGVSNLLKMFELLSEQQSDEAAELDSGHTWSLPEVETVLTRADSSLAVLLDFESKNKKESAAKEEKQAQLARKAADALATLGGKASRPQSLPPSKPPTAPSTTAETAEPLATSPTEPSPTEPVFDAPVDPQQA